MIATKAAIRATCRVFGVSLEFLTGESRSQEAVFMRAAITVISRKNGDSYPGIGRALHRDHTTILHADRSVATKNPVVGLFVRMIEAEMANDTELQAERANIAKMWELANARRQSRVSGAGPLYYSLEARLGFGKPRSATERAGPGAHHTKAQRPAE